MEITLNYAFLRRWEEFLTCKLTFKIFPGETRWVIIYINEMKFFLLSRP